ncbi:hypothetical protein ACFZCY_18535 [Streptomyces sp. NPDC007983]|uniref:hypothetical protein n=1 Tax=Streptomyces sp. NPDC007983 TaxID=3364800 RepID=UPI0036E8BFF9
MFTVRHPLRNGEEEKPCWVAQPLAVLPEIPNPNTPTVDVAFDDARVPLQGEASDDGVAIAVDTGGEGVEAGQVVLPDGVGPVRQAFALALGEHDREVADMPDEGVELGAMKADGLELELFGLGEGFRAAEDPSGDLPR